MNTRLALIGVTVTAALLGAYLFFVRAAESPQEVALAKVAAEAPPLGVHSEDPTATQSAGGIPTPMPYRSPKELWSASNDLFELYRQGINSKDPQLQYMAREAVNICLPFAMKVPFSDAANRRDGGANAAEVLRARAVLEKGCRAFMSLPASDLVRQRTEVNLAVQNAEFPVNPARAELSRNPSAAEVREARKALSTALNQLGSDGLIWLGPALGGWIEHVEASSPGALSPEFRDVSHIDAAVLLSQCLLGYECGPASTPYLFICSSSGTCPGSLEAYALNGLGPEQTEAVRRQAQLIAKSIAEKDFSAFGL